LFAYFSVVVGPYVSPHMRFTHAPVTEFSIFYLLDGAKKLVRFYIYICLCACLGRLVLTTRALVSGLFRHCRVYGNILPPAGTDTSV
jgi:hypothetical protein